MVRVWHEPDGAVKITQFLEPDLKDRDCANLTAEGHVHPDSAFEDFDSLEAFRAVAPQNRKFRNCWEKAPGGGVHVNLVKARAQRLDEIRTERNQLLDASDKDVMKATDQGNTAALAGLQIYRQSLRDLPATVAPALDALMTDSAIEAYAPEWPAAKA